MKKAYPINPLLKTDTLVTIDDYKALLSAYQSSPLHGGFSYAYPNHFSQNRLTDILMNKLQSQGQEIHFGTKYSGHQTTGAGVEV